MKKITQKILTSVLLVFVWPVGFATSIFNDVVKKDSEKNTDTIQSQYHNFSQDRKLPVSSISGTSFSVYDQEGITYDDIIL